MTSGKLASCLNISDIRQVARRRAHKMVFDYIDGGADDEKSLTNNSAAFDNYRLMHRVLVGVDEINPATTLLGEPLALPFILSPAAGNRLFHTEGERAVARAASELNTIYSLSSLSSFSIEDIAAAAPGRKWFQLYVWKDRALVKEMISRARAAGYQALILTVDFPITGYREREYRNGFTIPPRLGFKQVVEALKSPAWTWDYIAGPAIRYANLSTETTAVSLAKFVSEQLHAGFTWQDAEWLLGEWNGPAVIKGVVRCDDARLAIQTGFNAISVSNHGGRQLDGSPAPVEVLEDIVQACGCDADIILDGGVRRGTDILKALCLGAKAVSFARPYLYGLAAGGERGVALALEMMKDSLIRDMALLGVRSLADLDESFIRKV